MSHYLRRRHFKKQCIIIITWLFLQGDVTRWHGQCFYKEMWLGDMGNVAVNTYNFLMIDVVASDTHCCFHNSRMVSWSSYPTFCPEQTEVMSMSPTVAVSVTGHWWSIGHPPFRIDDYIFLKLVVKKSPAHYYSQTII